MGKDLERSSVNEAQARELVDTMKVAAERAVRLVQEFEDAALAVYEAKAWVPLGYATFAAMVTQECGVARGTAYRWLTTAKVRREALGDGLSRARLSQREAAQIARRKPIDATATEVPTDNPKHNDPTATLQAVRRLDPADLSPERGYKPEALREARDVFTQALGEDESWTYLGAARVVSSGGSDTAAGLPYLTVLAIDELFHPLAEQLRAKQRREARQQRPASSSSTKTADQSKCPHKYRNRTGECVVCKHQM